MEQRWRGQASVLRPVVLVLVLVLLLPLPPHAVVAAQSGARPARDLARLAPLSRGETVAVTIRLDGAPPTPAVQAYLTGHGGTVANTGPSLIEAYVPVAELDAVSNLPGVRSVEPIIPAQPTATDQGATVENTPYWNAAAYDGTGIKIGIIDTGFTGYGALIGTAVPAPVAVRCYTAVGVFTSNLADVHAVPSSASPDCRARNLLRVTLANVGNRADVATRIITRFVPRHRLRRAAVPGVQCAG